MSQQQTQPRPKKSLTIRTMRTTILTCVIMAVIAMAIGLSIYGSILKNHYIANACTIAHNAAMAIRRSQPETAGLVRQVMEIYESLTPEEQLQMVSDDPAERAAYRTRFAPVDTASDTGSIYDNLFHLLPDFNTDADYVTLGMYDRANNRLVYVVDPDENSQNRRYPGDWETVTEEETRRFLTWTDDADDHQPLYNFSRSADDGMIYTAAHPIENDDGEIVCFVIVDVREPRIVGDLLSFALKIGLPLLFATALLAWLVSRYNRRTVAEPIDAITCAAQAYAQDRRAGTAPSDHFTPLHIHTGDELENLCGTMADMEQQLNRHEEHLTRITAEKERVHTELSMAGRIQSAMLPDASAPFPERGEFDLSASMNPAKEVGGDFYDFFLIDDDHLGIVIADVSGKGVPAALFMMSARIVIHDRAMMAEAPSQILADANEFLCSNNRMEMFVTAWVGILELSTGILRMASAGHEHPAVYRAAEGTYALLQDKHSFVLGGLQGMVYKEIELRLREGDRLFLYTDGVPEANNANKTLYGTERMIAALNRTSEMTAKETLEAVRADVDAFVGDTEQFDDLTMLCVVYKGPSHLQDSGD